MGEAKRMTEEDLKSKIMPSSDNIKEDVANIVKAGMDAYHRLITECAALYFEEKAPVMLVLFVIIDKEKMLMRNRIRVIKGGYSEENIIRAIEKTPGFVQIARYSMVIDNKIWEAGLAHTELIDTGDGIFDMNHIPTPNLTAEEAHDFGRLYWETAVAHPENRMVDFVAREPKRLLRQVYNFEKFAAEKTTDLINRAEWYMMASDAAKLAKMLPESEDMKVKAEETLVQAEKETKL